MHPKIEPKQKAGSIGVVWLVICILFWVFQAFYSLPEEYELVEVEGEITKIELHGSTPEVRWFTIRSNGGANDLCIADLWRSLAVPEVGDRLLIKGYEPNLSPCDYQAMEVHHDGEVLVSYGSFRRSKSHKLDFFGTYFIAPLAVGGLLLVAFGAYRNRQWKRSNSET